MRRLAATVLIIISTIVAGCGGIERKIEANCEAQVDLENVLGEPVEGGGGTKEDCVRKLQAARKHHEKIGRMQEFEKDLDDTTKTFSELKEKCEDVGPGAC